MPKIQWERLPREKWAHLRDRARERRVSQDDLFEPAEWKAQDPDVPEREWYKDFGTFKLCGTGRLPSTLTDIAGGACGALSKTPLLGSAGKGLQFDGIAKFAHLSRECRYAALHGLGIQPPRTSFDIADLVMQHFPDPLRDPMSNCPDRFVHS